MSNVVDQTREFYRTRRRQAERKKNVTDEMGQSLSTFVNETEYNKTAVQFAARIDRLAPEKRADVLRSLDAIREHMSGVWDQEKTEEMDFSGGSAGTAAAQQFERENRPSRRKQKVVPIKPTPHEVPEAEDSVAGPGEMAAADSLPWEQ